MIRQRRCRKHERGDQDQSGKDTICSSGLFRRSARHGLASDVTVWRMRFFTEGKKFSYGLCFSSGNAHGHDRNGVMGGSDTLGLACAAAPHAERHKQADRT